MLRGMAIIFTLPSGGTRLYFTLHAQLLLRIQLVLRKEYLQFLYYMQDVQLFPRPQCVSHLMYLMYIIQYSKLSYKTSHEVYTQFLSVQGSIKYCVIECLVPVFTVTISGTGRSGGHKISQSCSVHSPEEMIQKIPRR